MSFWALDLSENLHIASAVLVPFSVSSSPLFDNLSILRSQLLGDAEKQKQVIFRMPEEVGVHGAKEFLDDPNARVKEVQEQLQKYAPGVRGVPHFQINGRYQFSCAQPPNTFLEAFRKAANGEGET